MAQEIPFEYWFRKTAPKKKNQQLVAEKNCEAEVKLIPVPMSVRFEDEARLINCCSDICSAKKLIKLVNFTFV